MHKMFARLSIQRIVQICIGLALLVGSLFFLKLAFASIIATRPNMAIVDLERHATTSDIELIEQHLSRLGTAIQLFPSNANFYSLAGRYHVLSDKFDQDKSRLSEAPIFFAKAVELEPTAYQHRAHKVQYLYKQNGWTQEVNQELEAALKVGKYEKLTQTLLLPISFANWNKLTDNNQHYTHQMLDNMFLTHQHYFRFALRVAQKLCVVSLLGTHAQNAKQTNAIDVGLGRQQGCK